jgi:hypothetical protein
MPGLMPTVFISNSLPYRYLAELEAQGYHIVNHGILGTEAKYGPWRVSVPESNGLFSWSGCELILLA